jgi:hypothetical protein
MNKKFDPTLLIAIPLLGIVGGGYLSLPITSMTRGKEPWTSMALVFGLGSLVFLIGHYGFSVRLSLVFWAWFAGSIVYFFMTSARGFSQHIEPFFAGHMIAFACLFWIASMSDKKTSNAVRACPHAKSCAETTTRNNSKNNLAATSGILIDSALRQNFKKAAPNARSTIRTIHPSDALPHFSSPHAPCFSNFFSTNKTKQKLNHPLFSSFD